MRNIREGIGAAYARQLHRQTKRGRENRRARERGREDARRAAAWHLSNK